MMLPRLDGLQPLRQLRSKRDTPVIMLTARDAIDDHLRGLGSGADDYLVKPFSFLELLARVKAITRRGTSDFTRLVIDDLSVDLIARRASRGQRRINVTAREFGLLGVLARRNGRIMSKTAIAELVWDITFDTEINVVDVAIKHLREDRHVGRASAPAYGAGHGIHPRASGRGVRSAPRRPIRSRRIAALARLDQRSPHADLRPHRRAGLHDRRPVHRGLSGIGTASLPGQRPSEPDGHRRGVGHADDPARFRTVRERMLAFTPADGGLRFIVRSDDPTYRYGIAWPADAERGPGARGAYCVLFDGRVFMAFDRIAPARGQRPAVTMTVAVDLAPIERTSLMLSLGVLLMSALCVALATAAAHGVVKHGLRPLVRLSDRAAHVTTEDLSLRLPLDDLPVELDGLTRSFNDALARLQDAYSCLSAFTADVAHELRTALGNMIGKTQVALCRSRSHGELEAVLQSNLEDLDRLRGIIDGMLFLARADQGALVESVVPVSLAALARKAGAVMDALFERRG